MGERPRQRNVRLPERHLHAEHAGIRQRSIGDRVGGVLEILQRRPAHDALDEVVERAVVEDAAVPAAPYREVHFERLGQDPLVLENADQRMETHRPERDAPCIGARRGRPARGIRAPAGRAVRHVTLVIRCVRSLRYTATLRNS